jgi:hypothetical protein
VLLGEVQERSSFPEKPATKISSSSCHAIPTSPENSVGVCEPVHWGTNSVDIEICHKKPTAWCKDDSYDTNNTFTWLLSAFLGLWMKENLVFYLPRHSMLSSHARMEKS